MGFRITSLCLFKAGAGVRVCSHFAQLRLVRACLLLCVTVVVIVVAHLHAPLVHSVGLALGHGDAGLGHARGRSPQRRVQFQSLWAVHPISSSCTQAKDLPAPHPQACGCCLDCSIGQLAACSLYGTGYRTCCFLLSPVYHAPFR